jgi:nitronate monooxygenase
VRVLDELDVPIVQAPMAGGVSTPRLAAAVSDAGGLGFLAAGYLTPDGLREQIRQLRALTGGPFGVNLFVPDPATADAHALAAYRDRLVAAEAGRHGVTPRLPDDGDGGWLDDHWDGKLAVLHEERVPLASFTFGCPAPEVVARLRGAGTEVVVTVTSPEEAAQAVAAGADALCVQGPEAGAHRGTFDNHLPGAGKEPGDLEVPVLPGVRGHLVTPGDDLGLLPLLRRVHTAVRLPLVAAGGLVHGRDVAAVLVAGARAAQLGTAFLACPESGAHPAHKAALTDPAYRSTAVTRAFSGRPARALVNRFVTEHTEAAPAAYPHVHYLTKQLRAAAAAAGDPHGMSLWAGQGHPLAAAGVPAGELVRTLAEQAAAALAEVTSRLPRAAASRP